MNDSYGYDAQGNLTTIDGSTIYTYGPFGELASAGGMSYKHGADGQRLLKSGAPGTTYFAPDAGGTLLAEEQGSTWMDYVWLNGRLVTVIANGGVFPLHDDQTGRPQVMTDPQNHNIDWAAKNTAFDRTVTTNVWGNFNLGFPGQYHDDESDLWQNGYRDYDASLSRYIESDPIGLSGGINSYAYVGNNPIINIGPTGLRCTPGVGCWTTTAEAYLANSGNYGAYYALACSGGDSYACFAGHVAANDNTWGHLATDRLTQAINDLGKKNNVCEDTNAILEKIRKDLARDYASYLPNSEQTAQWPTAMGVAQFHWAEFAQFGLPPSTFGGTPLGSTVGPLFPGIWCRNCQ